ncbi:hypothetical protein MHB50_13330 [Siminovitchia sp. FSL H7-0308]|uniref:DNA-binding transcriptional regulator YafY n=1 Tax=Siminovitchia thermophila TaxID=1245522 RepID=A0ABS2R1D0_9BACI|nr:hypothetical protein [Siminovitchia thermophila]MBM7713175.1 putative DNA-binding transcriptional regulator YafY [Siminovitchia thermophila]ONK24802.1 hypothetical protein BLX87_02905 [Bacillus sp. VT-16-64]
MKRLLMRAALSGERLEIIYLSENNQLSQRVIKVLFVSETTVKAYCYFKKQCRTFKRENILSVAPFGQRKQIYEEV